MKITECNIKYDGSWGSTAIIVVTYEDGASEEIYEYFPDELTFSESEFIGLTKEQAIKLIEKRNRDYLRF